MLGITVKRDKDIAAGERPGLAILIGMRDQDGPRVTGNDFLSDTAQKEVKRPPAAMGAHDHQIMPQFICMFDNASGHVFDLSRMHVAINLYPPRKALSQNFIKVGRRVLSIDKVGLTMDLAGCVFFYHMHQRNARMEPFREESGGRYRRFSHPGTVEWNEDVFEHRDHPVKSVL